MNSAIIIGAVIVVASVVAAYLLVAKHDEGRWA